MIKKTITYTDFNGETRTEPFYFHLSRAELVELETSTIGGYKAMVEEATRKEDTPTLFKVIKDFIFKSYGEKSTDGKRFVKTPDLMAAFEQSEAYSVLLMELMGDDKAAADFINGIVNSVSPGKTETPAIAAGN